LSSSARLISLSIVVVPALVSCELESRTVAPVEPGVVMHAILNPSLPRPPSRDFA
jgi:hypothetical protein